MRIDGKQIAESIFQRLHSEVKKLTQQGIVPHLAIILVGDDPASASYVRQKEIKSQVIEARCTIYHLPSSVSIHELDELLEKLNNDSTIHGVIVQRPLPSHFDQEKVTEKTLPEKDIDGFHKNSPYSMPLAEAVMAILRSVYKDYMKENGDVIQWLQTKNISVIGKGSTGGNPVIEIFKKMRIPVHVIDSKTTNKEEKIKSSDIIISAVGKPNVLTSSMLKKGCILICIGMYRGKDGKLHGDYEEEDIKEKASYYTPVPGGVGPVNVAMLLTNLVKAVKNLQLNTL